MSKFEAFIFVVVICLISFLQAAQVSFMKTNRDLIVKNVEVITELSDVLLLHHNKNRKK